MAGAEEELYKVWKNLTLTGKDSENSRYRVWDYPIKEQARTLKMLDDLESDSVKHVNFSIQKCLMGFLKEVCNNFNFL